MPATIVVVEDDPDILTFMEELLDMHGYQPIPLASSLGAHTAIRAAHPDLVITDLEMEERESGMRLLEALRADAATANQLLEHQAHFVVPYFAWTQVEIGKAAHDLEQQIRMVKRRDLFLKLVPIKEIADVGTEPVDIINQVSAQVGGIAEQLAKVVP